MRLRELEIFNAVMRARTTIGAAELLSISQPAVSKALKHLEAQTGLTLFKRLRGRLCPTPEAQTLYKNVSNVFARLETIDRIARDLRGGRGGVISVAATPSLGSSLLARSVVAFRAGHPGAQVIFRSITSHDVARRVAGGEADFGTVHSKVDLAGLEVEPLMTTEIVCILPRTHPLAAKDAIALDDLMPHPLISYRPGTPIGTRIAGAFQAAGLTKPIDVQTSLSSTACLLSAQGTGIALTDPFAVTATEFSSLVVRAVRPRIAVGVDLLFSRENPISGIAMKLVEQVRIIAGEMATSIARLTRLPDSEGQRRSRVARRATTNGLAPGRGSATHLAVARDHPRQGNNQAGRPPMKLSTPVAWSAAVGACLFLAAQAQAQAKDPRYPDYPHDTVTLITSSGPGGGGDIFLRQLTKVLGPAWGIDFVVENVPGSGGAKAMQRIVDSPADGTVFYGVSTQHIIVSILSDPPVTYEDMQPVVNVVFDAPVLYVPTDFPFETLSDLIEHIREHPGTFKWGVGSAASGDRMAAEVIKKSQDLDFVIATHDSGGAQLVAVLGGSVELGTGDAQEVAPHVESGDLRILAALTAERLPNYPDVATAKEQGVQVVPTRFRGLVGHKGLPPDIIAAWEKAIKPVLEDPEYAAVVKANDMIPAPLPHDEYDRVTNALAEESRQLFTELGIIQQ